MDKFIEKLIDSPWFIRILALVLALLLFENVYEAKNETTVNVPQDQETVTIDDVPVKIYYDTENLVVSGVPDKVSITLSGPKPSMQQARIQRGFEVYVDLTGADIGTQKVPIQIKDISDKLTVVMNPATANVSVQEKVTEEFNVAAEFNNNILSEGYYSEMPVIKPNKVKITGAKDVIDQISYVKAIVDVNNPIKETITREANILVLDQALNKLNVMIEPAKVNVTIPVKAFSKKVPIQLVQSGSSPKGVKIESVTLDKQEATIIGNEEALKNIASVRVELDISKIEKDTVMTLPVTISKGIVEVDPATVKVTIDVSEAENITLSNLPIKVQGLPEQYNVVFRQPENGETSITIFGLKEQIEQVNASDFTVSIDVSNLQEGEHNVALIVNGPDELGWQLERETVTISIAQKEV